MIKEIYKSLDANLEIPDNIQCLFYLNDTLLVLNNEGQYALPIYQQLKFIQDIEAAFILDDEQSPAILIASLKPLQCPSGFSLEQTRSNYHHFNASDRKLIAKSYGYIHWYRMHQFCGRCQSPTVFHPNECAWLCKSCQHFYYPKINPSMIVLVTRGRELLLARSPHFAPGIYSTLAGYVAPGESVEETIMREVKEEVNITVKNIRYFGSQTWPFPDTLMLGFYAEYDSGVLKIDEKEIEAAAWFTPENLPPLPRNISIGWLLIDGFVQQHI